MKRVRISVSDVDSWLYFMGDEDGDMGKLMSQLRKQEPQNEAMRAGSALHSALETATPGNTARLEADGYTFFVVADIDLALTSERELKMERIYSLDDLEVELVGKVDGVEGDMVIDHKSTGRFNPDWLMESYQWRFYLDMSAANRFQWQVFVMKETGPQEYDITDYHPFRQYRYPELAAECKDKLREFVDFLGLKELRWPTEYCTLVNLLRANMN